MENVCSITERGVVGCFVFFFLIFESRAIKQDRRHPHQQSRASSHSKHERTSRKIVFNRGKHPGQADSCNPVTAAPGARNMPSTTRTPAIAFFMFLRLVLG